MCYEFAIEGKHKTQRRRSWDEERLQRRTRMKREKMKDVEGEVGPERE